MATHDEAGRWLFQEVKQFIFATMVKAPAMSWCLILSYDDNTHSAKVRLQPDGGVFDQVPVLIPFRGLRMPHTSGMQGCCLLIAGMPQVLLGVTYTTRDPLPARGLTLEEDLYAPSIHLSGALYLGVAAELPPPSPLYQYALITVSARAPTLPNARPAATYHCLPSADGSLHWTKVASAP